MNMDIWVVGKSNDLFIGGSYPCSIFLQEPMMFLLALNFTFQKKHFPELRQKPT